MFASCPWWARLGSMGDAFRRRLVTNKLIHASIALALVAILPSEAALFDAARQEERQHGHSPLKTSGLLRRIEEIDRPTVAPARKPPPPKHRSKKKHSGSGSHDGGSGGGGSGGGGSSGGAGGSSGSSGSGSSGGLGGSGGSGGSTRGEDVPSAGPGEVKSLMTMVSSALGVGVLAAGMAYLRRDDAPREEATRTHRLNGAVKLRMETFHRMIETSGSADGIGNDGAVGSRSGSGEDDARSDRAISGLRGARSGRPSGATKSKLARLAGKSRRGEGYREDEGAAYMRAEDN